MIATSPIAAVVSNPRLPDNPIVECNDAFVALTGYGRDEIIGHNCRFLAGPGTEPWLTEMLLFQVNQVPPANTETFLKLLNGPDWVRPQGVSLDAATRQTILDIGARYRAVTVADYEWLALNAWPQSAQAGQLPGGQVGRPLGQHHLTGRCAVPQPGAVAQGRPGRAGGRAAVRIT